MMMGLDAPGPGISVFQARLAVGDQAFGRPSASPATPEPDGPRKRGQSSALADGIQLKERLQTTNNTNVNAERWIIVSSRGGLEIQREKVAMTIAHAKTRVGLANETFTDNSSDSESVTCLVFHTCGVAHSDFARRRSIRIVILPKFSVAAQITFRK
jgi:hypothetical protein